MDRHIPTWAGVLALAITLPACAQKPTVAPGQCKEGAATQFAVGKVADAKVTEEARLLSGASRVRTLKPNQMVTMEFDAARLTLDLDAQGKVVKARCG